uniref:ATP-binding protein n=1 Tax=Tateyamaria pelophila TaxID=328415 RepID=UPI001CBF8968
MKKLGNLERREFIELKKQFVHPSTEISQPEQLIGREGPLKRLRTAFEREGSNPFIWGLRGVGKTSLAHSACHAYPETVSVGPVVACEANSTIVQLFEDIVRRQSALNSSFFKDKTIKIKLAGYGFSVETGIGNQTGDLVLNSVNQASDLLNLLFPPDYELGKKTAIVIDEFDKLKNRETITFFTDLAKQLSVDDVAVKLIFCGVASDFKSLVGAHGSVGRYLTAVELTPMLDDQIWQTARSIMHNFGLADIPQVACHLTRRSPDQACGSSIFYL